MDIRYYWLQDRVDQNQFQVKWKPGAVNLGDLYTKHHPAKHHKEKRNIYVKAPKQPIAQLARVCYYPEKFNFWTSGNSRGYTRQTSACPI